MKESENIINLTSYSISILNVDILLKILFLINNYDFYFFKIPTQPKLRNSIMKKLVVLIFLSLSVSLMAQVCYAQKIDVYKRPLQTERSRDYDAIHYKVKLRFDEDKKVFWGENTITISPFKNSFTKCVLNAKDFVVTSVQNKNTKSLKFEQTDNQLTINFKKSYHYSDTISFTVYYNSADFKTKAEVSRRSTGISFFDETPNHPKIIEAISWPEGARQWYPCYDHPNDKTTQEMFITVKNEYKVLSNGRLIGVKENKKDNTKTFHWSQEQPHSTYLSMFVAGPYEVVKDSLGSLPINYWVYKKDVKHARRSFHKTPKIIEFYNKEFGYKYPWAKYDQVIQPGFGGGMECTSATLIGERTIHDAKAEKDYPSHGLVAHEAAHQWVGDLITLRDWGHTWINESFGTYYEYVFTKHDLGEEEGAVNLLNKKNSYLREANNRYIRPIVFHRWDKPSNNFDSHTYPKGAIVLQMMRWILGDEPFQKAISHFLHKHEFQPADTHDFLTAIKETTGQNLDWFFDQWLYKPGHPIFESGYTWNETSKETVIKISQVQDFSKNVPVYKTPVNLSVVTNKGKKTTKVWLKNKVDEFRLECKEKPLMVRFDDGNFLLKEWTFQKSEDELLYQLKHDDVIGRMWAATELGKLNENFKIATGLKKSAQADPFWAVRREAVQSIGSFNNKEHVKFLKDRAHDKSSKVRTVVYEQLGNNKQADLVKYFKDRFKKDDSYAAQAEILTSIGKCGDKSSIKFLKEIANMKMRSNVIRAANRAIEEIEKK